MNTPVPSQRASVGGKQLTQSMWCVNKDMDVESFTDIFVRIAETETVTHRQEESPSHVPLSTADIELEQYLTTRVRDDGLRDALSGGEKIEPPP